LLQSLRTAPFIETSLFAATEGSGVKSLFARLTFTGFGAHSLLSGVAAPPLEVIHGHRPGRLRAKVRARCPRVPGVYGMVDATGELIYVGKAKCLRARLLSYFRPRSRDPKAGRIVGNTFVIAWEPAASEFAALLRELELIRRWQPRFNVQGQPHRRRRIYVCVGRKPAPYVFTSARPPRTARQVFGPVPAGDKVREAVRRVNDWFRLRDCPQAQEMVFADQRELFPLELSPGCIRHEIGQCLGPCAAVCSRDDYAAGAAAAVAFLEGGDRAALVAIERDMLAASAATQFERAAALRDKLASLQWLAGHLDHLREAAGQSFVYALPSDEGPELWYAIHGGRVRAVFPAPHDDATRRHAAAALAAIYPKSAGEPGGLSVHEIDGVLLVASWFRRNSAERQRRLSPQEAAALLTAVGRE
jgi:excinuclease ABC subunit C